MTNITKKIIHIILLLVLPLGLTYGQAIIVFQEGYMVEHGGTAAKPVSIVLANSNANAIVPGTGWLISENEFDILQWNVGTATGSYTVPFGYSTAKYLPLTLDIGTAGTGGSGVVKFSTYHTIANQETGVTSLTGDPSDVTNLDAYILPGNPSSVNNSYNVTDRFYDIDANTGYTTKPAAANITFSYISGTANTEVGGLNTITESNLMAERFNSTGTAQTWSDWFGYGCTDAVVANVGTVQTGPVPSTDLYRSWSLWDEKTPLPLTLTSVNNNCNGVSEGTATVTLSGGIAPYTYAWTGGGGNAATATGLAAGTYTVNVSDNHGCVSTATVIITQPVTAVGVTIASQTNIFCNGEGLGSATANIATGGTGPYTYSWSSGGGTNTTASNLTAGTYTVTATDNKGCLATASVVITEPAAPINIAISSITTIACQGLASINARAATGGTGPYKYSWAPSGGTNLSTPNLSAGTYTITVTDANGCTSTASQVITLPAQLAATAATISDVSCYGENNGKATCTPTGGSAPYTYSWFPGGGVSSTESNLSAGIYTITVTDKNGCDAEASVIITQTAGMTIVMDSTFATPGACNGKAWVKSITGGAGPYTYSWSPGGAITDTIKNKCEGIYCCTITQSNGCSQNVCVNISSTATGVDNVTGGSSTIDIYPNPTTGQFTITGIESGMVIEIYDYIGRKISNAEATDATIQLNIAKEANGVYFVRILGKDGSLVSTNKIVKTR